MGRTPHIHVIGKVICVIAIIIPPAGWGGFGEVLVVLRPPILTAFRFIKPPGTRERGRAGPKGRINVKYLTKSV
jgi:hypothetical protein